MAEGNLKTYQVRYEITAQGNASSYFQGIAESATKMTKPLNELQAQINYINRSLQLLGRSENLNRLFNLKPTIDVAGLKTSLAEAEKLVSASANRMSAQMGKALANVGSKKAPGFKKSTKEMIEARMKELERKFALASGSDRKITDKGVRERVKNMKEATAMLDEYKKLKGQLSKIQAPTMTAQNIIKSVKSADEIKSMASAINSLNNAGKNFKSKSVKFRVDANIEPAIAKVNSLLKTIRESTAAIPVTLGRPGDNKKGNAIKKDGKASNVGLSNAAVAEKDAVTKFINNKKNALAISTQVNEAGMLDQLKSSIANLNNVAKQSKIQIHGSFNGEACIAQLEKTIVKMQELAKSKGVVINAMAVANGEPNKGTETSTTTAALTNGKDGGEKSNSKKKVIATQSQINAWERHRQAMSELRMSRELDKIDRKYAQQKADYASRQAFYEKLWGRDAVENRIARNASLHNAREYARVHELALQQQMASGSTRSSGLFGGVSSNRAAMKGEDFFTRSRAFWYPLTGNTSFGARTPVAVDMAKGMGTMFAIGGAMSAIGSSLSQSVEYQNIMKTTNAILKNGSVSYSNSAFGGMEKIVRRVGMDTKFTAPQVANAAKFLAMAGYDIPSINAAIRPVSDIALIGDLDLGATADKLTNVMTTFGINPEKMKDVADIMTTTFTRSNTDMMMLAESAKYAGGIAHLYGGRFKDNFADVMAMFGVLGNAGIQASSAGTTIRMMYQNLMQPNKNQRAIQKQYQIYTRDASGNPLEMIDILKQISSKVPKDKLADVVGSMFRITAQPGAAALATHLEGPNGLISLMEANRSAAGTGIAENIANEKKGTMQGLIAQVQSTFTEALLQAFEKREGGWAGMLIRLRDYLAKPETVQTLSSTMDLVENLLSTIGKFAKVYAEIYHAIPGVINFWIKTQLVFTQLGYLVTPVIQMIGVLNMLKTTLGGVTSATVAAATAEGAIGRGRAFGAAAGAFRGMPVATTGPYSGLMAANIAASMVPYQYSKPYGGANPFFYAHGRRAADGVYYRAGINRVMPFNAYSGRAAAVVYGGDVISSNAKYYRAYAKRWGDISASTSISEAKRMMAAAREQQYINAAIMAEQLRRREISQIAGARHSARIVSPEVMERYSRITGKNVSFGLVAKNTLKSMRGSFADGLAMSAGTLPSFIGSIRTMLMSLLSGLAKAIGFLVGPIGLAVGALTALGAGIYKIYSDYQKRKEQLEIADKHSKWVSDSYKDIQSDYLNASMAAGGFKPVTVGYQKQAADPETEYSIGKNQVVADILEGKTSNMSARDIYGKYVQNFRLLPDYLVNQWRGYTNPLLSEDKFVASRGGYTGTSEDQRLKHKAYLEYVSNKTVKSQDELREIARKLAVIAQWGDMARKQDGVKQAINDLQKAMYNKDFKRAQEIVNAYKPTSGLRMSYMPDAASVGGISDPTKYYEWQYAQYKVLNDMWSNYTGPAQNYQKAMSMIDELKGKKSSELKNYDATSLAQTIISAVPVAFNGTVAQITLDKMGRVDWTALANSVNDGIPFTIAEQQEILKNTYDAIYNDPNIKNFTSLIDLLQYYLPEIANARSPYGEIGWIPATTPETPSFFGGGTTENRGGNGGTSILLTGNKGGFKTPQFSLYSFTGKPGHFGNLYNDAVERSGNSQVMGTVLFRKERPDLFPEDKRPRVPKMNVNSYTRNGTFSGSDKGGRGKGGNKHGGQKDYANTYDRSAARPTQVIINIDKLANFDRTAIAKNADERAIAEAIENKIAEAVAMLSAQALNTASNVISQGV